MADDLTLIIERNTTPRIDRKLREVLADAYTFVRSAEANQAFATVTIEQLMEDQIKRNGESEGANKSQFDPYSYDPSKPASIGQEPQTRANFIGGADTTRAAKRDFILAIKNELTSVIKSIKEIPPEEVAPGSEYIDATEVGPPISKE